MFTCWLLCHATLTIHLLCLQPDEQKRLFNILPFYSRMPRTPLFALLGWNATREVLALYGSGHRHMASVPRFALLPDG